MAAEIQKNGLRTLLEIAQLEENSIITYYTEISDLLFGRSIPSYFAEAENLQEISIYYHEHLGNHELGVNSMLMCIVDTLSSTEISNIYLFIYYLKVENQNSEKYKYFFEIGLNKGIHICFGGSDFDRDGLQIKEKMSGVFRVISRVYNIDIYTKIYKSEHIHKDTEIFYDELQELFYKSRSG